MNSLDVHGNRQGERNYPYPQIQDLTSHPEQTTQSEDNDRVEASITQNEQQTEDDYLDSRKPISL